MRLTEKRPDGRYAVAEAAVVRGDGGWEGDAIERLGRLESAMDAIALELAETETALEGLRTDGKQRTVRFQSHLAKKLQLQQMLSYFRAQGL